jgi:hypothetical protein
MNDQAYSQTFFAKTGMQQLIDQVESFIQVYTEFVLVLLFLVGAAVAWMALREMKRSKPARSASPNKVAGTRKAYLYDSIC